MSTAVPAGQTAASLAAAGTLQFADRYEYVTVFNPSLTAVIYASADPAVTVPSATTANTVVVPENGSAVISNRNPLWYQSSNVIPNGSIQVGDGAAYNGSTNPSSPSNPGMVQSQRSLAGGMANPGTTVSVSGAATVSAAG